MNIFYKAAVAAVLLVVLVSPTFAAKRLALVIGNDIYKNLPPELHLKKARNDARAVAKTLDGLGFKVTIGLDVDRFGLNQTLDTFANQIEPGDTATVFFAGHGVRIEGRNYLLPADVPDVSRLGSQKLLAGESIAVDLIADRLKERGARVALLILDACRNNPFKNAKGRSVGGARGLASMEPPEGTFILFSAGAGQTALDRLSDEEENPNSVFTRLLVPLLAREGLEVGRMARLLRQEVKQLAATIGHTQTPAVYNEVTGDFYLLSPKAGQQAKTPAPVTSKETVFWNSVKDSTDPAGLEAYLKQYPGGTFASLAKIRLNALKPKVAAVIPARSWSEIKGTTDMAVLNAFIKRFPDGLYADAARARRIELRRLVYSWCDPKCAWMGVQIQSVSEDIVESLELDKARGAFVSDVTKTGPAERAGIRSGDVIVKVDNQSVEQWRDLPNLVAKKLAGNQIIVEVLRQGRSEQFNVSLGRLETLDKEAVRLYRKAAEKGDVNSMSNLRDMYSRGDGIAQSDVEAVRWYRKAIEKGHAGAMFNLAIKYDDGKGVKRDGNRAAELVFKALKLKNSHAVKQMTTSANAWSKPFRRALQQRMKDAGIYNGSIDGAFGPATRDAIKRLVGQS